MTREPSASDWLSKNDPARKGRVRRGPKGDKAKHASPKTRRMKRGKNLDSGPCWIAIKDFVEAHKKHVGSECICVPGAQKDVPASVDFFGKNISAARYMLLLTQGAPKSEKMVTRHLCGNGHLSCINPEHLAWGSDADNIGDMARHRKAGDDVKDRLSSFNR